MLPGTPAQPSRPVGRSVAHGAQPVRHDCARGLEATRTVEHTLELATPRAVEVLERLLRGLEPLPERVERAGELLPFRREAPEGRDDLVGGAGEVELLDGVTV